MLNLRERASLKSQFLNLRIAGITLFGILYGAGSLAGQTTSLVSGVAESGAARQQLSQAQSQEKEKREKQVRDNPLTVIYTGALFGYYRMEPDPEEPKDPKLAPVRNLLDILKPKAEPNMPQHEPTTLILGMGDNFGPEMGAALQLDNNTPQLENDKSQPSCARPLKAASEKNGEQRFKSATQGEVPIPIALYKDGARVARTAECDNVVKFLMKAGYQAIVPGREDFLYSSTWLARIANNLQKKRPSMLAANLRLKYKKGHPNASPQLQPTPGSPVDPYKKWSPLLFGSCKSPSDGYDLGCPTDIGVFDSEKPETPLGQDGVGYTIVDVKGKAGNFKVLVVGVVGNSTMEDVSPSNKRMCFLVSDKDGKDSRSVACDREDLDKVKKDNRLTNAALLEFEVEAVDPVKPIRAILSAPDSATNGEPIAYRVLMAQMPRTEAEELAAKLRSQRDPKNQFDLVISKSRIADGTPWAEISYQKAGDAWELTPIVTPYRAYRDEPCKDEDTRCIRGYKPGLFRPDSRVTLTTIEGTESTVEGTGATPEQRTLLNSPPNLQNMETAQPANPPRMAGVDGSKNETAMHLLMAALDQAIGENKYSYEFSTQGTVFFPTRDKCAFGQTQEQQCEAAITKYLLEVMQKFSQTDVALLESRDIFLGYLPAGYTDYDICTAKRAFEICRLRVALDRVLWKGDYSERVMMSGKEILSLLAKSKTLKDEENSLKPRDAAEEWLVSFGIMSQKTPATDPNDHSVPSALSEPASDSGDVSTDPLQKGPVTAANDLFAVPSWANCKPYSKNDTANSDQKNVYCVNGETIRSDYAYSIITTDHLANDTSVYTTIAGLPADYREQRNKYLTERIADSLWAAFGNKHNLQDGGEVTHRYPVFSFRSEDQTIAEKSSTQADPNRLTITKAEEKQQERQITQIDIAKLVAAYNGRVPQGGDGNVAGRFQGATDTRASSPLSFELDLEAKMRASRKITNGENYWFSIGSQGEFAFDRSVQGNLTNNPVNASYPLNSSIAGAFLQLGFKVPQESKSNDARGKNHPKTADIIAQQTNQARHGSVIHHIQRLFDGKTMFVFAPFQYQRQVVGSYLFFPFASPLTGELTLHTPRVDGFSHRFGYRGEGTKHLLWDPGSYLEFGLQAVVQNHLLSSVTFLKPGAMPLPCPTRSTVTINTCVKNAHFVAGPNTTAVEALSALHSEGAYWDIHWQKGVSQLADKSGPRATLMFDSTGDWFAARPLAKSLSSQTRYDIPLKLTLAFPVFRNLGIGPSYSPFFYSSQINHNSLFVETFALNARWYFARDAAVKLDKQAVFRGPASADETKTAKVK